MKQQLVDEYGAGKRLRRRATASQTSIDLGAAEARARGDREVAARAGRAGGRARRDRPARRQRRRDGRRPNFRESQFNLAAQGERQPGSAFKPFVLAAALQQGIAPAIDVRLEAGLDLARRPALARVATTSTTYLGTIDLDDGDHALRQHRLRAADRARRPAKPSSTTRPHARHPSPLNPYFAIGLGARGGQPARDGARVRGVRRTAAPHRRRRSSATCRARSIASSSPRRQKPPENAVAPGSVLRETRRATVTTLLQHVVQSGTGKRAALADRPVAGKTGTTENYGDAWFVGYTPQLVVAVWVGYPDTLRPMLTEYHGDPVAGGTFPALIWKSFMESALRLRRRARVVPAPPFLSRHDEARRPPRRPSAARQRALPRRALDRLLHGHGPERTANCKPNEVDVPRVVGQTSTSRGPARGATARVRVVYQPAKPLQRVDRVSHRCRRGGRLSSYDTVTLIVPRAAARRRPEADRPDAARGARQAPQRAARGRVAASRTARPGESSRRRRAPGSPRRRDARQPGRRARLRKREPASP